jgi:SEC-C motif-containing protein
MEGIRKASTAEELMRSRYSAYASGAVDYILRTTHITTRNLYDLNAILDWSTSSKWLRLQIVSTKKGMSKDSEGFVEFKATYQTPDNKMVLHHENSYFKKEDEEWFFVEPVELK